MKRIFVFIVSLGAMVAVRAQGGPTMGWSSWNTYRVNISEQLIKRQADAMVKKGLADAGYRYVNIDDGYFGGRDADGRLLTHPQRFPNGLKPVVDHIHSLGLKAGIYSDAGRNTCGNYYDKDSLAQGVGLYGHDQQDCDFFFKELGFDFIKVDFCGGDGPQNSEHLTLDEQERYTAIAQAIRNTGRDDVRLNVCRWNYPGTWVSEVAGSWRISHDIRPRWSSVAGIIQENLYLSAYCRDGRFNDMDMLEVGRGMGREEDRTHFAMWCIMSSPLLIGCDMEKIDAETLSLLTNPELIAVNQDPLHLQAYVAEKIGDCYLLVKDIEEIQGNRRVFAVYNPLDIPQRADFDFKTIDLGGDIRLRDILDREDAGTVSESMTLTVPAHGVKIYVATATERLMRTHYEAECGYISDYQELRNQREAMTAFYEADDDCDGGMKVSWLGGKPENDLVWDDVYVPEDGTYKVDLRCVTPDAKTVRLSVNDGAQKTIGFPVTSHQSVKVKLKKGRNTIRVFNKSYRMPDVDYMTITKE